MFVNLSVPNTKYLNAESDNLKCFRTRNLMLFVKNMNLNKKNSEIYLLLNTGYRSLKMRKRRKW